MKAGLALLLALALARPLAGAQDRAAADTVAASEMTPPARAALDGRAYWARFDADQAARRAQWEAVDVRTPRILTLSLLAPGAGLLLIAAVKALIEASSTMPAEGPYGNSGSAEHDRLVNGCLAGAGGLLAGGAIGAGVWWGRRRAERNRLKRQVAAAANDTPLASPVFALRGRTGGFSLVVRGRF